MKGIKSTAKERIRIQQGDITTVDADAIVNAANSGLVGGGGVDGAIHRAAGPKLMEECRMIGGCPTGQARLTKGYDLKARYVIHAVGPIYSNAADDPVLLAGCYKQSFDLARENQIRTLAFPAISCGVYGYPIRDACRVALETTLEILNNDDSFEWVAFVLFSRDYHEVYAQTLAGLPN